MELLLGVVMAICILMLLSAITKNKIIDFISRGCIGSVMMVVMNCLLPQYVVGISLYTVGFAALLGIPGVMTLYILRMIL